MKKQKNAKIVKVQRPIQYCALPILLAIVNAAISGIVYAISRSLYGAFALAFPILIFGYVFLYQVTWLVELRNSEIMVRTLLCRRTYSFSQISDVTERFSAAYHAIRLELVFQDGKYVDVCDNYKNYIQFRKCMCSKFSIRRQ